jgi:hypothetical protein
LGIRIQFRIQGFDDQKLKKKIYNWKTFLYFWIENCYLLILWPPQRTHKLQEKHSALKRENPALQKMKILYFFLWIIFALLDPDPATQINADPDPDPDPQPCWKRF